MMASPILYVLLLLFLPLASGHAILTSPTPRAGTNIWTGVKLQPFSEAATLANQGCGGSANSDPGVTHQTTPPTVFTPGQGINVQWTLTIPHPQDNTNSGVRIAIHYDTGDSFEQNILAGGVGNDPQTGTVSAESGSNGQANSVASTLVQLPAGKTCTHCTLQWIWAAEQDGGSYIGCADIAITNTGQAPDYTGLASQAGNALYDSSGSGQFTIDGAGGGGGCAAGGMFFLGLLLGAILSPLGIYLYQRRRQQQANAPAKSATPQAVMVDMQPSQPPPPGGPPPSGGLPPNWNEQKDPASGKTYYYNTVTNATSWTKPTA